MKKIINVEKTFNDMRIDRLLRNLLGNIPQGLIEKNLNLVMDGQHRMEVAKELKLNAVPCLVYCYEEVKVWSLRKNYIVNADSIIKRVLGDNIYPYKTAKHAFPDSSNKRCRFTLEELKGIKVQK